MSNARISQGILETAVTTIPDGRISQALVEVPTNATDKNARISQCILEVIYKETELEIFRRIEMVSSPYLAGQGALWAQPYGVKTKPEYLGCHAVGDIAEPKGDITLVYCPDESAQNAFKVVGSYKGAPGPITTTITTKVFETADWLEKVSCTIPLYIIKTKCGRRDVLMNYERVYIFDEASVTNMGLTGVLAMDPNDNAETQQTFDISAQSLIRVWKVSGGLIDISAIEDISDIYFCGQARCASECGDAQSECDYGYVSTRHITGSAGDVANVYLTEDNAETWTQTATNPFGAGEDIAAIRCIQTGVSSTRLIALNGTTGAGAAEISVSDDEGATWTSVTVGAVVGQYFLGSNAIFVLNQSNIWMVTDGGYIYYSDEYGIYWDTQEAGVNTTEDLYAVFFANELDGFAGGTNNALEATNDGGVTWNLLVAPAAKAADTITAIWAHDALHIFVGYDDGDTYYTRDGGTTWYLVDVPGVSTGEVVKIQFANKYVGYITRNLATGANGRVYRTFDGGYNWEQINVPTTTAGFLGAYLCSTNNLFVVGEVESVYGTIIKVS